MPGAALKMDIQNRQNVELFLVQGGSKVAGRMELQGKILKLFGWNERQELPLRWCIKANKILKCVSWNYEQRMAIKMEF
jgi:hypothetical protein